MPAAFAGPVVETIEAATRALGLSYLVMPSGAFHDAQFRSEVCRTGMLFVPSERGISHNPVENAKPGDLTPGARVLAAALVELASA